MAAIKTSSTPRLVCDTNLVTQRDIHLSGDDQCLGQSDDNNTPMISNDLHTGEEEPFLDQCIPVWRAYNSEIHSEEHNRHEQHEALDNSHTLPIVNVPPHEWATLATVLENLYRLNTIT